MKPDPLDLPRGLGGPRTPDLVEVVDIDPRVRLDIRYATTRNFAGVAVYSSARAFLHRPVADALRHVNDLAHAQGYGLLIFDAYRPWSVTRLFWEGFPTFRPWLADPLQGSRHNRGCAVDLSLVRLATGEEVAMPSGYDEFSVRADPAYGGGSIETRAMRDLLRRLMESGGFTVYENEWWHFDFPGWRDFRVLDLPFDEIQRPDR